MLVSRTRFLKGALPQNYTTNKKSLRTMASRRAALELITHRPTGKNENSLL
jgi:hypothetical protein